MAPTRTEGEFARTGTSKRHGTADAAVFELAEVTERGGQVPRFGELLIRRPVAATALLPKSVVLFTAGAVAGALGEPAPCPSSCIGRSMRVSMCIGMQGVGASPLCAQWHPSLS
jgi:hypothetical protein